jgi:hypothetical protein
MEKRRIGSLGVSLVGLGCNNFGWRIDAAAAGLTMVVCEFYHLDGFTH